MLNCKSDFYIEDHLIFLTIQYALDMFLQVYHLPRKLDYTDSPLHNRQKNHKENFVLLSD